MPAAFDRCQAKGGKIFTKSLPNGKYQHYCVLNGKRYYGYVKSKKSETKKKA